MIMNDKFNNDKNEACGAFFIFPKELLSDEKFRLMSLRAKLLFCFMLDRLKLSEKNGLKEDNEAFIYCSMAEIQRLLSCGPTQAVNTIKELVKFGLIRKKRQGQGKPTKYFINKEVLSNRENKNYQNDNSRITESIKQELPNRESNNTENSNTEDINTLLYASVEDEVRDALEYDDLIQYEDKTAVDFAVDVISDTIRSKRKTIYIGSENVPIDEVRERLRSLNGDHVMYAVELMNSGTTQVRDVRAYMLKLLYNAPKSMDLYYSVKYERDRAHG